MSDHILGLFEMSQIYVEPIPGDQREMHAG